MSDEQLIAGRDDKGAPLSAKEVEERTKKKLEADAEASKKVKEQLKKESEEAIKADEARVKADEEFVKKQKAELDKPAGAAAKAPGT